MTKPNYYEYVVSIDKVEIDETNINIQNYLDIKDRMDRVISRIKKTPSIKSHEKQIKTYVKNMLHLECDNETKEVRVLEKRGIHTESNTNFTLLVYEKTKIPIHNFPATTKLHTLYYTHNTIFRLHNKVFLNFEEQFYPDIKKAVFKTYINYNHTCDVDTSIIKNKIEYGFKLLGIETGAAISEIFHDTCKSS